MLYLFLIPYFLTILSIFENVSGFVRNADFIYFGSQRGAGLTSFLRETADHPPDCKALDFPDEKIADADKQKFGCPPPGTKRSDLQAFNASPKCNCGRRGEPVCAEVNRRFRNECQVCCFNKCVMPKGFDLNRYPTCSSGMQWVNWGYEDAAPTNTKPYKPDCKKHGFPDGKITDADRMKDGCPPAGTSHNNRNAFDSSRKCDCSGRGTPVCTDVGRRFRNECTLCCFNKCLLKKGFNLLRHKECPKNEEWVDWGYPSTSSQDSGSSTNPGLVTILCGGCSNTFFPKS